MSRLQLKIGDECYPCWRWIQLEFDLWYELWTESENSVRELPTLIYIIKPTEFDTPMLWYSSFATNFTELVTPSTAFTPQLQLLLVSWWLLSYALTYLMISTCYFWIILFLDNILDISIKVSDYLNTIISYLVSIVLPDQMYSRVFKIASVFRKPYSVLLGYFGDKWYF